jgi:hypothetical protein
MSETYSYLGPSGTFTEAALAQVPEARGKEWRSVNNVGEAFDDVVSGRSVAAMIAIENSIEGGVTSTLDALSAAVESGLVSDADAATLRAAWIFASRARSAVTLWANKSSDVLPSDRKALDGIARLLEYPPGSASLLEEDYLGVTRRARAVFERLFYDN